MPRWKRRSFLPAVVLIGTGCSGSGVFQQPLATDQPARPPSTDPSLVLGGMGQQNDWTAYRNDDADRTQRQLYFGPNGRLYYEDGSAVEFDSVRRQLRDLRAEERIRPR